MLLMMNADTNAVMKANTSRPVPNTSMIEPIASDVSSATCWPVTTSVRSGRILAIAASTVAISLPSVTRISTVSTVPLALRISWAEAGSNSDVVAPAKPSVLPSPTSPTIVKLCWPRVEHDRDLVADLVADRGRRWPCRSRPRSGSTVARPSFSSMPSRPSSPLHESRAPARPVCRSGSPSWSSNLGVTLDAAVDDARPRRRR